MIDLLPGGDILREGLKDLEAGRSSIPGLLVLTAAPRLARCGVAIPVTTRRWAGSTIATNRCVRMRVAQWKQALPP